MKTPTLPQKPSPAMALASRFIDGLHRAPDWAKAKDGLALVPVVNVERGHNGTVRVVTQKYAWNGKAWVMVHPASHSRWERVHELGRDHHPGTIVGGLQRLAATWGFAIAGDPDRDLRSLL
jgi:hypothetical protein